MNENIAAEPEHWLSQYGDMLYRYALTRVRLEDVAEDLVQETLLAALQNVADFKRQAAVSTWLVGILKNKIMDYYRSSQRLAPLADHGTLEENLSAEQFDEHGHWRINLSDWGSPDGDLQNRQFWEVFYQCHARLPEAMARLFMLRLDGVATEDCCRLLGLASANQLWVTLSRARMRLRQCLELKWFQAKENA